MRDEVIFGFNGNKKSWDNWEGDEKGKGDYGSRRRERWRGAECGSGGRGGGKIMIEDRQEELGSIGK